MKPFLILQLRPEDAASDGEFDALLKAGKLKANEVVRVRMEKENIPKVNLSDFSGIIVGGGPSNVSSKHKNLDELRFEKQLHELLDKIIDIDFPYFGACYGLGIVAVHLGGKVSSDKYSETVEAVTVKLTKEALSDSLLNDVPKEFRAVGGHKESCQNTPPGAVLLASTDGCPVHMIRYKKNIYATQFHPELDPEGTALRIRVYKDYGYFKSEEADGLINKVLKESIAVPRIILEKFVKRYRSSG